MEDNELLFYDIETFKCDNLIVIKDIDKNIIGEWWNDEPDRGARLAETIKGKTLVHYNGYHYDDFILTLMLRDMPAAVIKKNNDLIIAGSNTGIQVDDRIHSLDCMQQIGVAPVGLKKIEGNMGMMIKESDVDFTIDRALTEPERKSTAFYCSCDVDALIEVYKIRKHSYFDSKLKLVEMLGKPQAIKWNTTTISGNLLLSRPLPTWATTRVPEHMWRDPEIPEEVWTMWEQVSGYGTAEPKVKSYSMHEYGCTFQFGFGGLHGAHDTIHRFENVKMLDVASMYPSIIVHLNILGEATQKYLDIKNERIKIKHTDKTLSNALKLVLNSVYGNLKNEYSILNNPKASRTVCIYGQIALYKLCKRLAERGCTLVNINTDGVGFIDNGIDIDDIVAEWQDEYSLDLELDSFDLFIQRDVNNYIARQGDHIKAKGGDVSRYQENKFFQNNNARILDIAIAEYLLNGTSVIDTLMGNIDKPILFQYILQAGRTYAGVYDEYGIKYNNVNRVFACKPSYETGKLYKKRHDGGLVNFADVPDHMLLFDDDCHHIEGFERMIDLNHYYQLINKKLRAWE